MPLVSSVLARTPARVRPHLVRHRELVKFALVGGTCFVLTAAVNFALKLTVLTDHPTTALTIATTVATIASYLMNRGWSFRARGGRRHRLEATLFALVSVVAIGVNDVPLFVARYALDLEYPHISHLAQEVSDFVSGMLVGTVLAMGFRWWALKRWVFPARPAEPVREPALSGSPRG
ncbi:GtrA family protein [Actinomadura parmotrematis]|uniref:GtrA family protein n=1 Tax=Actinomadura parmotrematis TaxID=2864039 RepID=A0ABS7G387_9ACTN|nr:GtrA family protein [Actinomadura parmotrematis]MBW8486324.1 GtrA family protein [Actinomadura parmotrematis]